MEIQEKYKFGGWKNCIRMTNGEVEIVVTTDVGPRIVRFGFVGDQNLFREFKQQQGKTGGDEWLIYGGHRLWHAPEVKPRTYFPDNNPVNYNWNEKTLRLIQSIEATTGIQKEMEINLGSNNNNVRILHRLVNKNLWDIEIAPWALSVMAQGGMAIIPQEPYRSAEENLLPVRPLVLWSYTEMKDPRFIWGTKFIQVKQNPNAKTCQKIGVLNTLGWAAYYLDGQLFVKRYNYNPEARYPDFGVNTEIYTNPEILEVETLGGMKKVPPGESVEHVENWFLFKATLNEDEEFLESELAPIIRKTDAKF
ncbi:MAG: hypothetical protein ISS14_04110 [Actinobacteria bacterium]|nr:hypothetical protein [Actinomycetota bacterium]MBL7124056.1 hypothetical protein [Actinomycetota bacterium]